MDLTKKTEENLQFMLEKIWEKLKIINIDAVKNGNFSVEQYDDIKDVYELVISRNTFSPSEMQAIAEELGSLRKS